MSTLRRKDPNEDYIINLKENEDLSKYAREIEEPTLLIWGEQDTEAPLNDAKQLEKIMIDAALIVLPGTHYAYLENLPRVVAILNNFF